MTHKIVRCLALAALVAAFLSVGTTARAQTYTGRIDITVEDSTGGRLPGVLVEVSGQMNQSATTDPRGEVHFLNLNVGTYQVKATLTGFNEWKSGSIPVASGNAVPLTIKLAVAGAKEEVTVTGEAPVLDNKKQTVGASVSFEELQNVPSARDPWVVMQSVPGIVMDRVNVGGSESGQQAGFMGKGAGSGDTTWNVDGMPITDMSSLSSPFYYDFDMFQEMNVVTGGSDPKSATGGIQMNFMLKAGTNVFHGSGKGYFENEGMQSKNLPSDLAYLAGKTGKGDRTEQFTDWGGELGGPVLKDRWWFWASYGKQDIRILKLAGVHDRTLLPNLSIKTQGQISKSLRGSFTYFMANKQKYGRDASSLRPQETTLNQDGPNNMYKGELNYVAGSNLFLVARYAHVKGGFTFVPQGGMDKEVYRDQGGVWHNSYWDYYTDRPQDAFVTDGNYFKGNHEFKFGFTWRKTEVHSTSAVSSATGNMIYTDYNQDSDSYVTAVVNQPWASDGDSKYYNFYVGDTITMKRATLNFGVRYDYQSASVLPSKLPAVKGFEKYIPSVTAPGVKDALVYKLWQPRVGVTYSLDEARKTQLRATYAMFTSQIGSGTASFLSAAQNRYLYYDAILPAGQKTATIANIVGGIDNYWDYYGFDPSNPGSVSTSIHKVGNYTVPKTHEGIIGLDRELMPNFAVSASFTYRYITDFNWRPTQKVGGGAITGADYVKTGVVFSGNLPTGFPGTQGGTYNVPVYGVTNKALYPANKGTVYQSRPGYSQRYKGFEVSATKRMSNRWMARFGFSTNSWREYFDGPTAMGNPTHLLGNPNIDGGYVVSAAGGSGKSGIYMVQPKYQFMANGAYQLPYQIDLGVNYLIRQGYPMPWYMRTTKSGDLLGQTQSVLLPPDFGQDRLPATQTFDMRIGKTLKVSRATINFDFDIFNLFNSATVLGRQYNAASTSATTGYTKVLEIMQPRIARIGMRLQF